MLIGVPGSGKSTWARAQGHAVLSSDEMRRVLSGDETNQSIHGKVFAAIRYLLRSRLEIGAGPTIIDATNLRRRDRKVWLQIAQKFKVSVEAVYFSIPLELALDRNRKRERIVPEDVIHSMIEHLQPPTREEGFATIRTISS